VTAASPNPQAKSFQLDQPASNGVRAVEHRAWRDRIPWELERRLVRSAAEGDRAGRDELVQAFLPLIERVARIYRSSPAVERAELVQEGVVGLLTALRRFDLARGTSFWAYASWWVRQAMQELVSEVSLPVVLSDRALRKLARVKDARRAFLQAEKKEPSVTELASATGFTREQVENLIAAERTPRALAEPIDEDESAGMFEERLADPVAEEEYERVDRQLEIEGLRALPSQLGAREQTVLRGRFGFNCPEQTLRELAGRLDLSAERVRQIEERALEKLRAAACA
jgi:RNA polymerase primary sigma factor